MNSEFPLRKLSEMYRAGSVNAFGNENSYLRNSENVIQKIQFMITFNNKSKKLDSHYLKQMSQT